MNINQKELIKDISHELAVWFVCASIVFFLLGISAGLLLLEI